MINKKVVIICSIIALIIVVSIIAISIKKFKEEEYGEETAKANNQNLLENQNSIKNEIEDENLIEENVTEENQTNTENSVINEITQNQIQGEEETVTKQPEENNDEKALNLVKEEWGEDDTVYYTIDNQSNNIYNISVRSKTTTATLAEYEVNINQGTVVMK